ncbi:MAG TPA: DUF4446 family protein [Candidatus Eremiobacteraceae bacterium]|nr:DUF4446 family protein [Candidatus Eremiobacteraceae bacterium]
MNDALSSFLTGLGAALTSPVLAMSIVAAIAVAIIYHWAIARRTFLVSRAQGERLRTAGNPADMAALRNRVDALEANVARSLQRVGFVRFNAFPDVGSELSYALAVVDGDGNGFLVSSIYSREEVRTYAKAIRRFAADKDMSEEERRAVELAKAAPARPS